MQREVINKQVEAFLLFIASISAVIIYLSRIGLDNDVMIVLKSVSLSYLIILFPNFFFKYLNKHKVKIFLSQPIVSFLVILLLIFSGFVKNIIGTVPDSLFSNRGIVVVPTDSNSRADFIEAISKNVVLILGKVD